LIRFIDLGKQIATDPNDPEWMREFCFYDTITASFLSFEGQCVFDSREDVIANLDEDNQAARRILSLLPSWVPKDSKSIAR
jgi:hypothetical protein